MYPVEVNQLFPVFPSEVAAKLRQLYGFYDWGTPGDMTSVRIVTSWATPEGAVEEFIDDLTDITRNVSQTRL